MTKKYPVVGFECHSCGEVTVEERQGVELCKFCSKPVNEIREGYFSKEAMRERSLGYYFEGSLLSFVGFYETMKRKDNIKGMEIVKNAVIETFKNRFGDDEEELNRLISHFV